MPTDERTPVDSREIMCVSTNRGGTARTARPRHQEVES